MSQITSVTPGRVLASNVGVSVPSVGNTVLLDIPAEDIFEVGIEILPTVQALDAFIVQGKFSPDGDFSTLYDAPGDFNAPSGLVLDASGNLTAQGAGTTGWLLLNVRPLYSVRILASGNGASTVTARAVGKK